LENVQFRFRLQLFNPKYPVEPPYFKPFRIKGFGAAAELRK
jgi:hypothetical protein